MRDQKINDILDEKETSAFGVRVPKKMLDRICAAYKKVTGGAVRGNPKGPALAYFAARGLLDWEDEMLGKKSSLPSRTTEAR